MTRVLTALLLIPAVVWLIFEGPPAAVWIAVALVSLLCLHECMTLVRAGGAEPYSLPAYASGALLVLAPWLPHPAFLTGLAVLLLALGVRRIASGRASRPFAAASATLFAVIYICGPFALARELHGLGPHWMFVVLLVNWVGDSAALYVGGAIGKHQLSPLLSPKKTWEGTVASLLLGAGVGAAYLMYFQPEGSNWVLAAGLCAVINAAGQVGDLVESSLKRAVGVKDSGSLLPGHGGMLDRMDGALFSFPAAYWFLAAAQAF